MRFSTHCNYLIISPISPFDLSPYVYVDWQDSSSFSFSTLPDDEDIFCIHCFGDYIEFGSFQSSASLMTFISKNMEALRERKQYNDRRANEFLLTARESFLERYISFIKMKKDEIFHGSNFTELNLDLMVDFEGVVSFVGGTVVCHLDNSIRLVNSALHNILRIPDFLAETDYTLKNNLISLKISVNPDDGMLNVDVGVNKFKPYWSMYRASGINMPLILVQNLLKRKIYTTYFVNPEEIKFDSIAMTSCYIGSYDIIYIDLDETLIWKEIPLEYTINFLSSQKRYKRPIKLITRHKLPISETLQRIGLSEDYFDEIIRVLPHEKKSSFIEGNALFIDNEFPERLDVRVNCNIPVFDVDQLDFLMPF